MLTTPVLRRPPTQRELAAYRLAQRLDRPIATLGVVALGLWLVEPFTSSQALITAVVDLVWIGIALAFLVEFLARAVVAPETWPFLREHWWEVGLLLSRFSASCVYFEPAGLDEVWRPPCIPAAGLGSD